VLTAGGPGWHPHLQIGAYEDSIINLELLARQHVHVLLWIIVFITARYLVSVLARRSVARPERRLTWPRS
jgi:multiple sugar transport system permease protein